MSTLSKLNSCSPPQMTIEEAQRLARQETDQETNEIQAKKWIEICPDLEYDSKKMRLYSKTNEIANACLDQLIEEKELRVPYTLIRAMSTPWGGAEDIYVSGIQYWRNGELLKDQNIFRTLLNANNLMTLNGPEHLPATDLSESPNFGLFKKYDGIHRFIVPSNHKHYPIAHCYLTDTVKRWLPES